MKTVYTTQTQVQKNFCIIQIYRDHEWVATYDFHLDRLFYDSQCVNIYTHLSYKRWGTTENIAEIHNAIIKHLLSK